MLDDNVAMENPLNSLRIGHKVKARIIASHQQSVKPGMGNRWELSLRPSLLEGTKCSLTLLPLTSDKIAVQFMVVSQMALRSEGAFWIVGKGSIKSN